MTRTAALVAGAVCLLALLAPAGAQDGGPDFLRVSGLAAGEKLPVRSTPEASAKVIGAVSGGADGLRNLGCRGGLTFAQWERATPAEREAAKDTRWCRIVFGGVTGWAQGRFLVEGLPPIAGAAASAAAIRPSFDCRKADRDTTKLVCRDSQLAALDREMARLYALALNGPHMNAARKRELMAVQRGWIKGRDDCWKAEVPRDCVVSSYAARILELRQGYADARRQDAKGISRGPQVLECTNSDFSIGFVLIATDPATVAMAWSDRKLSLVGADARYAGKDFDGSYTLSIAGNDAQFEMPDGKVLKCRIGEVG
jgi:uncharacterized protein